MPAPKPSTTQVAPRPGPRCRTCGKVIDVPDGWSHGPAVRRHYWSEHREVMTRARNEEGAGE